MENKIGICYCCVWKGGEVLYSYNGGQDEVDNLAALCLEMIPSYHRWYIETSGKKTFGFYMNEGYVYFAIVVNDTTTTAAADGKSQLLLTFLEKFKDEFRRVGVKKGLPQQQFIHVVRRLIVDYHHHVSSLPSSSSYQGDLTPSPPTNNNSDAEGSGSTGGSTKAPLLGKQCKHEKKKRTKKDHVVIGMRGLHEINELRRSSSSSDRVIEDSNNNQETSSSSASHNSRKDANSSRSSQNLQKKWCRQVKIVLAIDAAVCVILFVIWLVICHGLECIR